ncbi:hypothetical protein Cgig2_028147 [Carnegiea gigantea]|uniref:Uncharacterized protein n=1 Tax=Carnegiea gigantea TaxID=171969 RepID=A0A9Q1QAG6_9CARY|nr:hypothetical protein Cgig2_028147 [Carnegiea gigantea]
MNCNSFIWIEFSLEERDEKTDGFQQNKAEKEFTEEYGRAKRIDMIDYQIIIHEGEIDLQAKPPAASKQPFLECGREAESPIVGPNDQNEEKIFYTIGNIVYRTWNHNLQKCPNDVEFHSFTQDENLFDDLDFFDAYLKLEALALKNITKVKYQ